MVSDQCYQMLEKKVAQIFQKVAQKVDRHSIIYKIERFLNIAHNVANHLGNFCEMFLSA